MLWRSIYTDDFCCDFVACKLSPQIRNASSLHGRLEIAAKISSVNGPLEFIRQLADITIGGLVRLQLMCSCSYLGNEGILLRRRRRQRRKQDNCICFAREKETSVAKVCAMIDVKITKKWFLYDFVRERRASEAGRRNLWCLSGPVESLSHWYCPSARGSTYDWQSVNQFFLRKQKYGLVRNDPIRQYGGRDLHVRQYRWRDLHIRQ